MALTLICAWAATPDDIGFYVTHAWFFWVIALFVPYSVFAAIVIAAVEFLQD